MSTQVVLLLQTLLGALLGGITWALWKSPSQSRKLLGSIWVAMLAVTLVPVVAWTPPETGPVRRIRVVSVLDAATTDALVAAFTRETGILCEVDPFAGGTQTTAELIVQGRIQPDVLLGGTAEIHGQLGAAGKLRTHAVPPDAFRVDRFDDPDRRWTPLYVGYLGLLYRPLPSLRDHPPDWITLLQERWKGRVAIPSPQTSGGGLVFLATQILRQRDPERGWEYLRLLDQNEAQWARRSEIPITQVGAGAMDVGVAWAHDVLRRIETERLPVELRIPEVTGYEVGAVSILEEARDSESAAAFVDFLVGKVAAEIQGRVGRRVPLRTDVELPRYVDPGALESDAMGFYDRDAVFSSRSAWVDRWVESRSPAP